MRAISTLLFLLCLCCATRASADELGSSDRANTFELRFQVAIDGALSEQNMSWLAEHVRRANLLFADSKITFNADYELLDRGEALNLRTRKDRHALGKHLTDRPVIHVFVVQSLKDVDIPDKWISGVHWRPRGLPGKHFVILSRKARPWTLAHELGHFFGNPHSQTVNNIMSYEHDGKKEPFFDAPQRARIAEHCDRFIESRELLSETKN